MQDIPGYTARSDLEDWAGYDDVREDAEDREGQALGKVRQIRDVYFILHIPKCAGRTVQNFLKTKFGYGESAPVKKGRSGWYIGRRILFPGRRKAPYRFFGKRYESLSAVSLSTVDFVFGFYVTKSMMAHFPDRNVKQAVLIRDPVSHFYSHYNFRMGKYVAQGLRPFGFDLWYKSRRPNPISKYLFAYLEVPFIRHVFMSDQKKLDVILDGLADFWHVGLHNECGDLIARIAKEQRVSADFEARNVTQNQFMAFAEFNKRYGRKIKEENGLDQAIFEFFSSDVPIEQRTRPKVQNREWRNIIRGGFVPWYILRYRMKRRYGV